MARWPDVPAVSGWLELDRRGRWLIRGEPLAHPLANAFISRNYTCDDRGRWYFQNGPQRVFVHLHYTPWVLRLGPDLDPVTHTDRPAGPVTAVHMDEQGAVLLETRAGLGLLDDRDLEAFSHDLRGAHGERLDSDRLARRLERLAQGRDAAVAVATSTGLLPVQPVASGEVPRRFGFDPDPRPDARERAQNA